MHQSKLCLVTLHRLSKDSGSRRLSSLSSFEDSTVSGHMIRIRSFGSLEDSVASVLPDSVFERLASSKTVSTTLKFESIEGNGYKKITRCKTLSHECSVWYNIVAAWDEDIQTNSLKKRIQIMRSPCLHGILYYSSQIATRIWTIVKDHIALISTNDRLSFNTTLSLLKLRDSIL